MLIKNKSTTRPYIVQGVTLVPGQDTEIPENLITDAQRDIDGMEDLEVVKAKAKPGPKPKVEDDDKEEEAKPADTKK